MLGFGWHVKHQKKLISYVNLRKLRSMNSILSLSEVPDAEKKKFKDLISKYRSDYIRNSQTLVDIALEEKGNYKQQIKDQNVSQCIADLREDVWQMFLQDEIEFNAVLMRDLHKKLDTPQNILEGILKREIFSKSGAELKQSIKDVCGEYAGRVFPYIYEISLSNTQSRRSRAGKTFEAIIYKIYEELGYEYDSQSKVGRKVFDKLGLGKKVDSILPNVNRFAQRRSKTIIGTMKTTLRERWQEVAEEIERTKIPQIHLLTADEDISKSKAQEMSNHNIIVVAYNWVAGSDSLKDMKNIISFEDYIFKEIPDIFKFWNEQ